MVESKHGPTLENGGGDLILQLVKKDLLLEFRSKEILSSMFIFGTSVTLIFALAFQVNQSIMQQFAPGLFWVVIFFTSVLGLNRLFTRERDGNALWTWASGPVDRGNIFVAKVLVACLFILIAVGLFLIPFFIFLNLSTQFSYSHFFIVTLLGIGSLTTVGCLISGLTLQAGLRDVLIPILFFPTAAPVAIAATKSTELIFNQRPVSDWQIWILILLSFFVIFGLFGYLVFSRIVEE